MHYAAMQGRGALHCEHAYDIWLYRTGVGALEGKGRKVKLGEYGK